MEEINPVTGLPQVVKRKLTDDEDYQPPSKRPATENRQLPADHMVRPYDYRNILLAKMKPDLLTKCRPLMHDDHLHFTGLYRLKDLIRFDRYENVFNGVRLSDGLPVIIKVIALPEKVMCRLDTGVPAIFEAAVIEYVNHRQEPKKEVMPCSYPKLIATYQTPLHLFMVTEANPTAVSLKALVDAAKKTSLERVSEGMARLILFQLHSILYRLTRREGVFHGLLDSTSVQFDLKDLKVQLSNPRDADHFTKDHDYGMPGRAQPNYIPLEFFGPLLFRADPATAYGFGVLLYNLVSGGTLPFKNIFCLVDDKWEMPKGLSPQCQEVIRACLAPESQRVAFTELKKMEWFKLPVIQQEIRTEVDRIKLKLPKRR